MARISLIVEGEVEFDREFDRFDAVISDLRPIWPDVRKKFWEFEEQQFSSEGKDGRGGKWKKLSKRYAAQKIDRYGPGLKILEATGALKESLTGHTGDSVYRTSKDEINIGTSLARGRFHHIGAGRLPIRKVIDLSDQQRTELMKTIQGSLVKLIRRGVGYVVPGGRG